MKVWTTVGSMQFEIEAKTDIELMEQLSHLNEVFAEKCCGNCQSENIAFQVRNVTKGKKEYKFPEMRCNDCFARLSYGANQEGGTLFPKRRNKDGKWDKKNRGWVKFVPGSKTDDIPDEDTKDTDAKVPF